MAALHPAAQIYASKFRSVYIVTRQASEFLSSFLSKDFVSTSAHGDRLPIVRPAGDLTGVIDRTAKVGASCLLAVALVLVACRGQQTLVVTATAYNSVPSQTSGRPTVAAWGDELRPGMRAIAVSPDLLELGLTRGTVVEIEGLPGTFEVLDKTSSRLERTIDIYMGEDVKRAREWGRKRVRITWPAG